MAKQLSTSNAMNAGSPLMPSSDALIESLASDLKPVRPLEQRRGMAGAVTALLLGALIMALGFGLRADLISGRPDAMFLISSGLFLVLALASTWAVIDMARPFVGMNREGWGWTLLMAAVLPSAALVLIAYDTAHGTQVSLDEGGVFCLCFGMAISLLTLAVLVTWLRRGAPSSPEWAGLLAGVASGAAGIFAVSLYCPHSDLLHIGIWHGAAVTSMGLAGRVFLPKLLAW